MSRSALARRASIARRCAGVCSSAVGTLGMMVITRPDVLNSISSPLLNPAFRRTAGGTTSGTLLLFLTATVIVMIADLRYKNVHFYNSRIAVRVKREVRLLRTREIKGYRSFLSS